jgi:hypothetical protein
MGKKGGGVMFSKSRAFRMATVLMVFSLSMLAIPLKLAAQQFNPSPQYVTFMNEIQRTYLTQKGWAIRPMEFEYPRTLASIVGHALRQQATHIGPNHRNDPAFRRLKDEAFLYLYNVVIRAGYKDEDGNPITADDMHQIAEHHMAGNRDDDITAFFGVRVGDMKPVIQTQISSSRTPQGPLSIPWQEEGDSISLLGVEADPEPEDEMPEPFAPKPPSRSEVKRIPCRIWWSFEDGTGSWRSPFKKHYSYVKGRSAGRGGPCKKGDVVLCCDDPEWGDGIWQDSVPQGADCLCVPESETEF